MIPEHEKLLSKLQSSVRELMLTKEALEEERDLLRNTIIRLLGENKQLLQEKKELVDEKEKLNISLNMLSGLDRTGIARSKIEALVLEVDKCIKLMDE